MFKIFGRDKILNCAVTQKKMSYSILVNQKKCRCKIQEKLKRIIGHIIRNGFQKDVKINLLTLFIQILQIQAYLDISCLFLEGDSMGCSITMFFIFLGNSW